jgi:ACS family tartrate transporter-like MFS transporter
VRIPGDVFFASAPVPENVNDTHKRQGSRRFFVKTGHEESIGERTGRKVSLRLLPFLFILYVIAFLDRVNFGYAALAMNASLAISAEMFGFLSGIFFIGYLLFEVPSNMILQRVGARIWIARIMICWGIVVIVTAGATSALQLAALRFILGVAEAGFFPGIILYITFWFRERELARTIALFMAALAVSNIIGAPVSTWILDNIAWAGIPGWRWLFMLEGVPAILLGIVTLFYLTDRPGDARWLEPEERAWLSGEIHREQEKRAGNGAQTGVLRAVMDRNVWHLGCIYCGLTIGLYGTGFWMPQIIRSLNPAFTNMEIGLLMMIPFIVALIAMIGWGTHSDRTGERRWHLAVPPVLAGLALVGAGMAGDPVIVFILLIIATAGIYSSFGPFWTWPPVFCTGAAAAVGIAVINSVGNAGGFIGPSMVGVLVRITGGLGTGVIVLGGCLILCGVLAAAVREPQPAMR